MKKIIKWSYLVVAPVWVIGSVYSIVTWDIHNIKFILGLFVFDYIHRGLLTVLDYE